MSKNPKYIKIMSDLESQIKNNELNPGDQIPTEKNLCEMYNASRMTVNKAIMMLCENVSLKELLKRLICERLSNNKKFTAWIYWKFYRRYDFDWQSTRSKTNWI